MPRVSVLLPVRDAAATLDDCLQSLRAQSLDDHEVIAVDDGSRDGSGERLRAAAGDDPRVRVLPARGRGLVAALNQALDAARSGLVARMDADDVAHPERLWRQAERLAQDPGLDVLGCRVRLFGEGAGDGMRAYVEWLNGLLEHDAIVGDLFVESPLAHPSVMLRRETLLGLGGYRDFDGPEDYELWLRAHGAGLRFAKCPETLLDWRDGATRLTRSDPRYAPERFRDVKIAALRRGALAGRAAVVWGAGPLGKAFARGLQAAGHEVAAFVEVDPGKLGQRIHGVPVVGLDALTPRFAEAVHLGAVGQPGARQRLRGEAVRRGLVDGKNFIAVA